MLFLVCYRRLTRTSHYRYVTKGTKCKVRKTRSARRKSAHQPVGTTGQSLPVLNREALLRCFCQRCTLVIFPCYVQSCIFTTIVSFLTVSILHFLGIALFAVNGAVAAGLEGNLTLFLATRTDCLMHFPWGFVISILKSHAPSSFRNLL